MIADAFRRIAAGYSTAATESQKGHPLAQFIRREAADAARAQLQMPALEVEGSPGKGNWATIPWIAVFDPVVTDSATYGHYVVYLFAADMSRVYLSLNQGTTAAVQEFGTAGAFEELQRRASLLRSRVPERASAFSDAAIDLRAGGGTLPRGYEAGHAFGRAYSLATLPDDAALTQDLREICTLYLTATARGGVSTLTEDEQPAGRNETLDERRRYNLHRRVERNRKLAELVKKARGYVCEGCGFDFEAVYGVLGQQYIHAHHLVPLSHLPEGEAVPHDPHKDFAVLCANCHAMVHRESKPLPLDALRALPGVVAMRRLHSR